MARANQAASGTRASRRQRGLPPDQEEPAPPPGARSLRGGVSAPKRRVAQKTNRRGCSDGEGSPPSAWKGAAPVLPPPGAEAPRDASPAGKPEAQRQPFPAPVAVPMPPTGSPTTPLVQPTQPAPPALTTGGSTALALGVLLATDPAQAAERSPAQEAACVHLLPTKPPRAAAAVNALARAAATAEVQADGFDSPLAAVQRAFGLATLGATGRVLGALGTAAGEDFLAELTPLIMPAARADASAAYLWALHREDAACARPLVEAYAKNLGFGEGAMRALSPRPVPWVEAVDGVSTLARAVQLLAAASASQAELDAHIDYLWALKAYMRQLAAACEGLGAGAAELRAEEVRRRLVLATVARLFLISMGVVVGHHPPAHLASWMDARFYDMAYGVAPLGAAGAADAGAGQLRAFLGPENREEMIQAASLQPKVVYMGLKYAVGI